MSARRAYFDYNATAPLRASARAAMIDALEMTGNASSVHAEGRRVRAVVETARDAVAALVGAPADGVVFTSGATEADAWMLQAWTGPVAVGAVEHDAVREARGDAIVLPVDPDGRVERDALTTLAPGTLVSVMSANNETGVLQRLAEIAAVADERDVFLHSDAVQTCGRIADTPFTDGARVISISAHKMGGPKGIGALVARDPADLPTPLVRGGRQERGYRGGTENVAAIAGFGAAAREAAAEAGDWRRLAALRDWIEDRIIAISPSAVIAGRGVDRLPNTCCVALPGAEAQSLVIAFDLAGFAVSAGAACSSGKVTRSPVLAAMGWSDALSESAIRISLGLETTEDEAERFVAAFADIAARHAAPPGLAA